MDQIEIKGKVNTAICYARVVEEEAIEQIRRMCDYPMTEGSRIRIMPDVHAGKGCTIGTTMTIRDKAVPNVVGVDIGCGMYTVNLGRAELDFAKIDEAAHVIPSGMNVWEGRQERFDLMTLACSRELKDTKRLERSLGTLGGGNHFIEIDEAADGTKYLVIHSGSRNLGKQVAEYYQNLAVRLDRGYDEYLEKREELIRTYKEQGRRKEIQEALKQLQWKPDEAQMPEDLCYLTGKYLEAYLHDVEICQQFARRNREKMAEILLERTGLTGTDAFHTIHNYIDYKRMIENVGYFVDVDAHTGISRAGVLCYFCDDIRVGRCALYALELFNGSIVIVCLRKCIGFRHNLCFRCRRFSTSRAVRRYGTVHLCCFLILFFLCFLLDFFCSSGQSPDSNAEDNKQNT